MDDWQLKISDFYISFYYSFVCLSFCPAASGGVVLSGSALFSYVQTKKNAWLIWVNRLNISTEIVCILGLIVDIGLL